LIPLRIGCFELFEIAGRSGDCFGLAPRPPPVASTWAKIRPARWAFRIAPLRAEGFGFPAPRFDQGLMWGSRFGFEHDRRDILKDGQGALGGWVLVVTGSELARGLFSGNADCKSAIRQAKSPRYVSARRIGDGGFEGEVLFAIFVRAAS
jgi:hypothetical protein